VWSFPQVHHAMMRVPGAQCGPFPWHAQGPPGPVGTWKAMHVPAGSTGCHTAVISGCQLCDSCDGVLSFPSFPIRPCGTRKYSRATSVHPPPLFFLFVCAANHSEHEQGVPHRPHVGAPAGVHEPAHVPALQPRLHALPPLTTDTAATENGPPQMPTAAPGAPTGPKAVNGFPFESKGDGPRGKMARRPPKPPASSSDGSATRPVMPTKK